MGFYLYLLAITLLMGLLAAGLWRKSGTPVFAMGLAFIYYWTFYGGFDVVTDLLGGQSGKRYHYLFDKMFPVALDGDYWLALSLYLLFVLALGWSLLAIIPSRTGADGTPGRRVRLSASRLLLFGGLALIGSVVTIWNDLAAAILIGQSGYQVTASTTMITTRLALHMGLNEMAMIPTAIGVAVLACGEQGRILVIRRTRGITAAFLMLSGALMVFGMIMGNKGELFDGLITGMTLYLINCRRPRLSRMGLLGVAMFLAIGTIDVIRTYSLGELLAGMPVGETLASSTQILSSNEAYAAHFSMYGVLHFKVAWTWGTSVLSLIASVVPHALWPNRPETIYPYYAAAVGATPGQGYTIHHATGWFLNFGYLGLVLGGMTWGLLWGGLFGGIKRLARSRHIWWRVFFLLAFAQFTGNIADLLRVGIEGYKVVIYAMVVPWILVRLASRGTIQESAGLGSDDRTNPCEAM